jgi:hypothetical protein
MLSNVEMTISLNNDDNGSTALYSNIRKCIPGKTLKYGIYRSTYKCTSGITLQAYLVAYPHEDKPGRIYHGHVGFEVRAPNVDGSDVPPFGSRYPC